ncbi:MFS transporter [Radiobacillus kanasensis]|uniref:MFS transporter n=1 Tax=Radiobacillus kanasensis TaxID=2844358 RepID=UPI001E59948A|nr:MFS transporter [Radiobacillus kanasensis]UFU01320.1 MFS transporter [Radiobacillus kanasensis]
MSLLKNKNFFVLFFGRIITNIGDSLYYVASMWLVHSIGNNPFYTGLAGFLILLPKALQFLVGPLVDKWKTKKVLVITQISQSILILVIPVAYYFDFLSIQLILIMMPIIAIIEEFAYPTQTKALPLIIKKTDLVKGNSLFAFAYQGVDIVFNALSGVIVAIFGAITIYFIDSVTFALAALFFSLIKLKENTAQNNYPRKNIKLSIVEYGRDLKEGIYLVFKSLLWVFLIGSFVANLAIGITMAILPDFSEELGGVEMYGILLTALSTGSLTGALLGPILGKYKVGKVSIICFTLGAVSWSLSGWLSSPIISTILFGLAWIPIGAVNVLFAGISQSIVPNRLLGRVNSVMYSFSIMAMPVGSLLGGYLCTIFDSALIFTCTGLGIAFIALTWFFQHNLRSLPMANDINAYTFKITYYEQKNDVATEK